MPPLKCDRTFSTPRSVNPAAGSDDNGSTRRHDHRTWSYDNRSSRARNATSPVNTGGAINDGARFRRRHGNEAAYQQ
jgi:hypothetical protein